MQSLLKKFIAFLSYFITDKYIPYNQQYKDILQRIMDDGVSLGDRTGVGRVSIASHSLTVDLRRECPTMNLRHAPIVAPINEMIGFIRGITNSNGFADLNCKYWHQNANENKGWLDNPFRKGVGDLGDVYGAQWTKWPGVLLLNPDQVMPDGDLINLTAQHDKLIATGWKYGGDVVVEDQSMREFWHKPINQLAECVQTILTNPDSRRILFHGWNPSVVDKVALPSCHIMYQFLCFDDELHLSTYQRSADSILGIPSNTLQAAWLLKMVAGLTGKTAATVTLNFGDAHIYANHLEAAKLICDQPLHASESEFVFNYKRTITNKDISIDEIEEILNNIKPGDLVVSDYTPGIKIPKELLPMAV